MVVINVPCTSFSKKILFHKYGVEAILLSPKDDVFHAIFEKVGQNEKPINPDLFSEINTEKYNTIGIVIPNPSMYYVKRNAAKLLQGFHKREIFKAVMHSKKMGCEVVKSIKLAYDDYNLTDDDYSSETCEREYKRFYQRNTVKKEGIFKQFTTLSVLQNVNKNEDFLTEETPIKPEQILDVMKHYEKLSLHFGCKQSQKRKLAIELYLMVEHAERKPTAIARKYKIQPQTVHYHIRNIKGKIANDDAIHSIIMFLLWNIRHSQSLSKKAA